MLATVMGRWKEAERHFSEAVRLNQRQSSKPWLAHAQYRWAAMLLARGDSADRPRALDLLDRAREAATELGMIGLHSRVEELRASVTRLRSRIVYPAGLSAREMEVLRLVAKGKSNHEIAALLFTSKNTVAKQVRSILIKTNCANRTEAAAFAMSNSLV
jgi:DNA-binding CsgD family transcriptional regulator